jgi:hypothetical protein
MRSLVEAVQQILIEGIVDTHFVKIGFDQTKAKELAKRWSEIPSQYKGGINILGTKTTGEVEDTFKRLEAKWSESKTGKEKAVKHHGIQGLVHGKDYIEVDIGVPDANAYIPLNHKASQLIASSRIGPCVGKWCTAENTPKQWDDYVYSRGIVLVYIITPDTKFAAAYHGPYGKGKVEFFDRNDYAPDKAFYEKFHVLTSKSFKDKIDAVQDKYNNVFGVFEGAEIEGEANKLSNGLFDVKGNLLFQETRNREEVSARKSLWNNVDGNFHCLDNEDLVSLRGSPKRVGGDFVCTHNWSLRNLVGGPEYVGGNFELGEVDIQNLKGAPKEVGGDFWCFVDDIPSLKGGPLKVGGNFILADTAESAEGMPKEIHGDATLPIHLEEEVMEMVKSGKVKIKGELRFV